jgi:hypothetical protein
MRYTSVWRDFGAKKITPPATCSALVTFAALTEGLLTEYGGGAPVGNR